MRDEMEQLAQERDAIDVDPAMPRLQSFPPDDIDVLTARIERLEQQLAQRVGQLEDALAELTRIRHQLAAFQGRADKEP